MRMIHWLSKVPTSALRGVALLRLDFNTEDEWRMQASLPTIKYLRSHAHAVVIISHRGRPKGAEKKLSLKNDALKLAKYLKHPVTFFPNHDFLKLRDKIDEAEKGAVFVLENLRFHPGEEADDAEFANEMAWLADYYVNDAFAVCHRKAASVSAITKILPSFGGMELEREIETLSDVIHAPKQPLVVILGGGKAHDKLGAIKYLQAEASAFLMGGAAANTFLKIKGVDVKNSLVDDEAADYAELEKISNTAPIMLPIDWIDEKGRILDIGPKSVEMFTEYIAKAKTILWSGPLGFVEKDKYAASTKAIAKAVVANKKAFTIAGGGETVMFLKKIDLDSSFDFISTGGGALLDYLAGNDLPGIVALER